jgi:hypothetical protein
MAGLVPRDENDEKRQATDPLTGLLGMQVSAYFTCVLNISQMESLELQQRAQLVGVTCSVD